MTMADRYLSNVLTINFDLSLQGDVAGHKHEHRLGLTHDRTDGSVRDLEYYAVGWRSQQDELSPELRLLEILYRAITFCERVYKFQLSGAAEVLNVDLFIGFSFIQTMSIIDPVSPDSRKVALHIETRITGQQEI